MAYTKLPAIAAPTADHYALEFSLGTPYQTDWLGIGANWMPFEYFSDLAMTAPQRLEQFTRGYLSGIKIVSGIYDGLWAYSSYPAGSANWTSASMTAVYSWLTAMKDRDIKVVFKAGWNFPSQVHQPFLSGAAGTPVAGDETVWASWLSESLHQMINVRGYTNVIGLALFTEPNQSTDPIPAGYTALEYYVHLAQVLHAKIVADDASRVAIRSRIVITGPQEQSGTDADTWVEYIGANAGSAIDVAAAHTYNLVPTFAPLSLVASNFPNYADLIARYTAWIADGGRNFWADEGWTVIGGDTDSTGYRATADAGLQMCRWWNCAMEAGCQAALMWTLHDETHWPDPASSVTQSYGVIPHAKDASTVRPSWYSTSLFANLTGGGNGTRLYRCTSGTTSLHGTAIYVPGSVRNAVNKSGEWTFLIINESATALRTGVKFNPALTNRTFYRYVYSAEYPPVAAAEPAYIKPWDMSFAGVSTDLPPNIIPGRSVVFFSTMNISAPTATSLSPAAIATSDSTGLGSPSNVNDGNFTNVVGSGNGWRKADNSSHYVQLTWPSSVTFSRLEIAFVGTTVGVVYATYTDTTSPAPVADYTVQYWNGSAYADFSTPINVTSNSAPNKTHTFTAVATTSIRLTVTSVALTGQVNQIGVYAT